MEESMNVAEDQIYAALDAEILKRQTLEDELKKAHGALELLYRMAAFNGVTQQDMTCWVDPETGTAKRGVR